MTIVWSIWIKLLGLILLLATVAATTCNGSDAPPAAATSRGVSSAGTQPPPPTPTAPGNMSVGFTASFDKVFLEPPINFHGLMGVQAAIFMARNEYEAVQMVIFPARNLTNVSVKASSLQKVDGPETITAADVEINVVGYVNLIKPRVSGNRTGWHPDPLLPNQRLLLVKDTPQPYLITVRTHANTKPGTYRGNLFIKIDGVAEQTLKLQVVVWNFTLPRSSRFTTASLADWDVITKAWPQTLGYAAPSQDERKRLFLQLADLGFRNRLPPVAFLANGLTSKNKQGQGGTSYGYPTYDIGPDGTKVFNARRTDELIDYMLNNGATHFFIGLTSDIYLYPDKTQARKNALLEYLQPYVKHLRARGLLDMAYVYGVDEPWGVAVQHARDTYNLVKSEVGADVRFMQNTNQNNDSVIGKFLGYFDALDINLGFYDINDAATYRRQHPAQLSDFWWNVNAWPETRPNLFLEYPLIDARIMGLMSYKYHMQGFEYWDLLALTGVDDYRPLAPDATRVSWRVQNKSLDGTLVYPAADRHFYSSLRFESFRDGMEDQEYLYLLQQIDANNPLLAVPVISGLTRYSDDTDSLLNYRKKVGEALSRAGDQGKLP